MLNSHRNTFSSTIMTIVLFFLTPLLFSQSIGPQFSAPGSIALDGDGLVYAWGDGWYGQLGNGTNGADVQSNTPVQVLKGDYSGSTYLGDTQGNEVTQIAMGNHFGIALTADGTVFAWGDNQYGQNGDGTTTNRSTPVKVLKGDYAGSTYLGDNASNKIIAIAGGRYHSLALATDGTVYAWGLNDYGALGDNSTTDSSVPVQVLKGAYSGTTYLGDNASNKVTAIQTGSYSSHALGTDGLVYSWGYNSTSQLGDNSTTNRHTPVKVLKGDYSGTTYLGDDSDNKITSIVGGASHFAAQSADGGVYTWGYNGWGQLGDNSTITRATPVRPLMGAYSGTTYLGDDSDNKITYIALGDQHSGAVAEDGGVYMWGKNSQYRLGDNTTTNRHTPVKTLKGVYSGTTYMGDNPSNKITRIALGTNHSIALAADHSLFGWGYNTSGELGDGSSTMMLQTAVQVVGVGGTGNLSLEGTPSADYYVDPSGTDDGSHGTGTGTDAWASIAYALASVSDPTTTNITINIAAGTYTEAGLDINRAFTNLTLNGASASSTIIQAHGTEGSATDRVLYITGTDESVTLQNLNLRHGKTSGSGGALYNNQGSVTLENCAFTDNAADYGAGIYSIYGSLSIIGSTISGNNATSEGGAIYITGSFTMTNSTVFDNAAPSVGGIYGQYASASYTLTNCTIANNTSTSSAVAGGFYNWHGTVYIKNTILANNTSTDGGDDFQRYDGTLVDNDYNIVEYFSGTGITFDASNNITGNQTNLNLSSTLADNNTTKGTQTLKTTSGSVAIHAGNAVSANNGVAIPTIDQRGAERNGTTDIGAYEYFDNEGSLPVELSVFTAHSKNGIVSLNWITASEVENLGFTLERSTTIQPDHLPEWQEVASFKTNPTLAGQGSTTRQTVYSFSDKDVQVGKIYEYRLSDVDYRGTVTQHDAITIMVRSSDAIMPEAFKMLSVYPNPFNPSTTLSYRLEQDMQVSIAVLDVQGRQVRTIASEHQFAGDYAVEWDGYSNQGYPVSSGIYFFNIQGIKFSQAVKIVKLD